MADQVVNLAAPVRLNLTEIDDLPVAEGWYEVEVITAEAKASKKGQPQINVMGRITDEASSEFNKALFWYLTFDEDPNSFAIKMLKRCVEAIPSIDPDLNYESYQAFGDDLVGKELSVHVKHGDYQGEVTANVNKFAVKVYPEL